MSDYRNTRLPEGFAEFLEQSGLPCPPLPLSALDGLERTDDNFFATDLRPVDRRPDGLEDMDALLNAGPERPGEHSRMTEPASAEADEAEGGAEASGAAESPAAASGEEDLRAGDFEPDDVDDDLSDDEPSVKYAGFGLAGSGLQGGTALYLLDAGTLRLCLAMPWNRAFGDPAEEREALEAAFRLAQVCVQSRPASGCLSVFVNGEGCRWSWCDDGGERGGGDAESLLDCLEQMECADDREAAVPAHLWMRV